MPHKQPGSPDHRPIIGITADVHTDSTGIGWFRSRFEYADAVSRAGGVPVLLAPPPSDDLVDAHARACAAMVDAVVFSGGADINTESLAGPGRAPLHPKASAMDARRQAFDLALFRALDGEDARHKPVLGICLGMQEMAAHRGARLIQHMHDTLGDGAEAHRRDNHHAVAPSIGDHPVIRVAARVASSHHQAVDLPAGSPLRVVARGHDGVIEAVDDPARPFYLGVQWHPERTRRDEGAGDALSDGLFRALVEHARAQRR